MLSQDSQGLLLVVLSKVVLPYLESSHHAVLQANFNTLSYYVVWLCKTMQPSPPAAITPRSAHQEYIGL